VLVPPATPVRKDLPEGLKVVSKAVSVASLKFPAVTILASVIQCGALERYPNLRIVLGESDIGWIPYVLERMDYEYEDRFKGDLPLKMTPSDYWRRQCRATFQYDRVGTKHLDDLGVENLLWASDYPHGDG